MRQYSRTRLPARPLPRYPRRQLCRFDHLRRFAKPCDLGLRACEIAARDRQQVVAARVEIHGVSDGQIDGTEPAGGDGAEVAVEAGMRLRCSNRVRILALDAPPTYCLDLKNHWRRDGVIVIGSRPRSGR